jgi:hypothetical protein
LILREKVGFARNNFDGEYRSFSSFVVGGASFRRKNGMGRVQAGQDARHSDFITANRHHNGIVAVQA